MSKKTKTQKNLLQLTRENQRLLDKIEQLKAEKTILLQRVATLEQSAATEVTKLPGWLDKGSKFLLGEVGKKLLTELYSNPLSKLILDKIGSLEGLVGFSAAVSYVFNKLWGWVAYFTPFLPETFPPIGRMLVIGAMILILARIICFIYYSAKKWKDKS